MTTAKKWSGGVAAHSDALDLEEDVFKPSDPTKIGASLKRSAEYSKRRKGTPLQSAMSMLNFYINRAGKNLPEKQRRVLERANDELRWAFERERAHRWIRATCGSVSRASEPAQLRGAVGYSKKRKRPRNASSASAASALASQASA